MTIVESRKPLRLFLMVVFTVRFGGRILRTVPLFLVVDAELPINCAIDVFRKDADCRDPLFPSGAS
jgi:hypothetical protein